MGASSETISSKAKDSISTGICLICALFVLFQISFTAHSELFDFELESDNLSADPGWINCGGGQSWQLDKSQHYHGESSMASGPIEIGRISSLCRELTGPGNVSFWWTTNTNPGEDGKLSFLVDGLEKGLCNSSNWTEFPQIELPSKKIYKLEWRVTKAGKDKNWSGKGWIDDVSIITLEEENIKENSLIESIYIGNITQGDNNTIHQESSNKNEINSYVNTVEETEKIKLAIINNNASEDKKVGHNLKEERSSDQNAPLLVGIISSNTENNSVHEEPSTQESEILVVDSLNPDPKKGIYPTIQQAIDNVTEGGIVAILCGAYFESIVVDKPLSLIGEDMNSTLIQGGKYGINVAADNVTIANLGVRSEEIGIYFGSARGCTVSLNNVSEASYGIVLKGCEALNIDGNLVSNSNNISIYLINSSNCNIESNIISSLKFGVYLKGSNSNDIIGNRIEKAYDGIVLANSSYNNTLDENIFFDDVVGCHLYEVDSEDMGNNIYSMACNLTDSGKKCFK
jgi:parallel beta-helix repeat protein